MKNRLKITTLLLFVAVSSFAQIEFKLNMEFDELSKSYKVMAIPNFSMKEFLWGPSQISLVFPEKTEDSKLVIISHNAGKWSDNSSIYAPKAQADCDFHGFGSGGEKLQNVVKDEPILLFELKPENSKMEAVRLFNNQKDPKSYNEGMKGSDFSHSIIGHSGEELYAGNLEKRSEASLVEELSTSFTVFPNPTNGKFTLKATGIELSESEMITVYSVGGIKLFESEFKFINNKSNIELPEIIGDQSVFLRIIDKNNKPYTIKIIIRK